MEQDFIKPTEEGKNLLLLRYVIVFLFACLFVYLWWPIWMMYTNTLPNCQIEHWNKIYFELAIMLFIATGIYFAIKGKKIHSLLQYPLPNALVFKAKKIKRERLAKRVAILHYCLAALMWASAIGTFINIQKNPEFKNICNITLFTNKYYTN